MKKVLSILMALVLIMSATYALAAGKIGVSMPDQSLQRWDNDGTYMKDMLEEAGYEVDIQYANSDAATQASQVEAMIAGGCNVLVIAPIDSYTLKTELAEAKAKNIPVVAYDRLIMDTDAVSYYTTFNNYIIGTTHGKYIASALDLKNAAGPFKLEIFAGDMGDINTHHIYRGVMDILSPYMESGKLIIPSGQKELEAVTIPCSSTDDAKARMDRLLETFYAGGERLDAVICFNDAMALGVTNSLDEAGIEQFPIITGQDCDIANVKNIITGKQSMSIFRDTHSLVDHAVGMVQDIMMGEQPELSDTVTYHNNVSAVPAYLCVAVFADAKSYEMVLVESGYYTEDQLK